MLFLTFLLILSTINISKSIQVGIIGGQTATDGRFLYTISVRVNNEHICGGSILTDQYILTAANCLYTLDTKLIFLIVGTHKLHNDGTKFQANAVKIAEHFNYDKFENDIALIQTNGKIEIDNVKTSIIQLNQDEINEGATVSLSGWGSTQMDGNNADDLQYIELKTISQKECTEKKVIDGLPILDSQLCTLTKVNEGACYGDAGGALVFNDKVVGVLIYGRPCALGYPDVYTKVSNYYEWINTIIKT